MENNENKTIKMENNETKNKKKTHYKYDILFTDYICRQRQITRNRSSCHDRFRVDSRAK